MSVNHSPAEYFNIASNLRNRRRFIRKAYNFIVNHNFDGLDLNWKLHQITDQTFSRAELVLFIRELKEKFEWDQLLLTSTFGSLNGSEIDKFDFLGMSKHLDYIQISSSKMDVINTLIKLGVRPEKIIVKLPLFVKVKTTKIEHYRDYSFQEKSLTYKEMCALINAHGTWTTSYDSLKNVTIAKNNDWEEMREIEYKGSRAIANMIRTAVRKNLSGAMISADHDDNLTCELERNTFADFKPEKGVIIIIPKQENYKFPLLSTVNEAIKISLSEISQESNILEKIKKNDQINFISFK